MVRRGDCKMKNNTKTSARFALAAAVLGLIGLAVYLVNTLTGYMAGRGVNVLLVVASVVAVAALGARALRPEALGPLVTGGLLMGGAVLLILSFALFALGRVTIVADVYFLPVNYPQSEQTSLFVAFAGLAVYLLAILTTAVAAFLPQGSED